MLIKSASISVKALYILETSTKYLLYLIQNKFAQIGTLFINI